MLKGCIVGFGGVAQAVHVPAWKALEEKGIGRLTGAYDVNPAQFDKKVDINIGSAGGERNFNCYTDLEEILKAEGPDVIDLCVPTPFHAPIAVELLKRGYAVHCEKPMARTYALCADMIRAAREGGGKLMIGQCLRFSPPYRYLKRTVEEGTLGKPLAAVFRRMSGPPLWAWDNWYMDHERSGGCLTDMHIHDLDAARFVFGEPEAVSCVAADVYSKDDVAHSRLHYGGLAVLAVGDWSQRGIGFAADYRVGFEKGTLIYERDVLTVYPSQGEPYAPELPAENMYEKELEYFMAVVLGGGENSINPPESAARTIQLVEKLRESAGRNGAVLPFLPEERA